MATSKSSSTKSTDKTDKKGSKLATIRQALFGAAKKKPAAKAAPKAKSAAKGKAKAPVKTAAAKSAGAAAANPKMAKGDKAEKKGAAKAPAAPVAPAPTKAEKAAAAKAAKAAAAAARHAAELESMCREVACEGLATSGGYCRLHYIKNWKKIKRKELILKEGKLNQYIEELVAKYPDKYIEAIRQDLVNDKDFAKVISDLDLDESVDDFDADAENADNLIDSIKRDFDDEGEGSF